MVEWQAAIVPEDADATALGLARLGSKGLEHEGERTQRCRGIDVTKTYFRSRPLRRLRISGITALPTHLVRRRPLARDVKFPDSTVAR